MKLMKRMRSALLALLLLSTLALPMAAANVRSIELSRSSLTMTIGDTRNLSVRFTPRDADGADLSEVSWRTNNSDVVRITQTATGVTIEALEKGTATVTAETSNGKKDTCLVTVRKEGQSVEVRALEMSLTSMTVRVDQTRTLWVSVLPHDATEDEVTWSSSDRNVAAVDDDGMVTGIAPGTAIITAEADGRTASCEVTVPETYLSGLDTDSKVNEQPNSGVLLDAAMARTVVRETARAAQPGETAYAVFRNKPNLSPSVLSAAAYEVESSGKQILLRFSTVDSDGNTEGAFTFEAGAAKDRADDLKTSVRVRSSTVQAIQSKFEKNFSNKLTVIDVAQTGALGFTARIAAKADNLAQTGASGLHFYHYNPETSKYTSLAAGNPGMDKNGYVHFSTDTGGIIVVSQGPLSK